MSEDFKIKPVSFPPEVLARLSPELSLQRHISLGLRPCLRSFEEFRNIEIEDGNLSRYSNLSKDNTSNNILGSNILRCGQTFVITTITGGILEEILPTDEIIENELINITKVKNKLENFRSVYPVVNIERGRVGVATDEEMIISQKLYDTILHSNMIPKSSLDVVCGIRTTDEAGKPIILYSDQNDDTLISDFNLTRKWSYVLYAKIQVFSRNGPLFDLCWNSLVYALRTVKLPRAFIDERATDFKIPIRTRGRSTIIRATHDIFCDTTKEIPLILNEENVGYASNFGVIDIDPESQLVAEESKINNTGTVLLADLETEAEETSILSTLSLITGKDGNLKNLSIVGAGSKITPSMISKSWCLAGERTKDLETKQKI